MRNIFKKVIEEINPFDDFEEDTNLLEEGILDSLTLMVFIERIEEEFNIIIPEKEVVLENFATIKTIEKLVNRFYIRN
mgnify:CR=1 FL=1